MGAAHRDFRDEVKPLQPELCRQGAVCLDLASFTKASWYGAPDGTSMSRGEIIGMRSYLIRSSRLIQRHVVVIIRLHHSEATRLVQIQRLRVVGRHVQREVPMPVGEHQLHGCG